MDKGVKKVRKSIEHRKRMRRLPTENQGRKLYPSVPQEEEKHGYYPYFPESDMEKAKTGRLSGFVLKGIISLILFFSVAIIHQSDHAVFQTPKEWTSDVLSDEFPFAKVNGWYRDTFGNPLAFTPENPPSADTETMALPVNGNITESFQTNGTGIMINPGETTGVSAIREGVVVFAGKDQETNKTVVVQHEDGSTSSYGFLNDIEVYLYQYVSNNQIVGEFVPSENNETVFFSIEKDEEYIDPVQVIQVDDQP
ncbi:M23 family metallopeptidase [Oceanobacillus piezotolerans]|uniref:M23 family metallopeptidase n=1 Tax=Oceanobacillus piezotolerans TaxID=2448030 RepID=A0A498DEK5_9BACI|nr:M23 family metallopeptidase [Oceanobacillus piezotolerans]RLL47965.1 M23 family metallopeptidase [Oceanobacillus piezotolerans]